MEKFAAPALIAFILEVLLCPVLIPVLKRFKLHQYIREDGPKAHQKKAGTPTMGGVMILISLTAGALFYAKDNPRLGPLLLFIWAFGAIGLADDCIKVVLKRNEGLKVWQKFLLQVAVSLLFAFYLKKTGVSTSVKVPFSNWSIPLGGFYYVFVVLMVVGFNNGANFTDGLDGLAAGVTLVIAVFLAAACQAGHNGELVSLPAAVVGSLLGFLLFNVHPARVFMGDTGSLALGSFVTCTAFVLEIPLLLFVFAFIYVLEVLSVILQVVYFKATGGKRLFRMAPIHHHFELGGWEETRVVAVFVIATAVLCVTALLSL